MTELQISLGDLAFRAEGGDQSAQYRLGILFLLGESVEQDLDAAGRWLERAGQHQGAHLLVEALARYQAARLFRKQPQHKKNRGRESFEAFARSFAIPFTRSVHALIGAGRTVGQKLVHLTASSWSSVRKSSARKFSPRESSARNRVARVHFRGGIESAEFPTGQTAPSRLRETL